MSSFGGENSSPRSKSWDWPWPEIVYAARRRHEIDRAVPFAAEINCARCHCWHYFSVGGNRTFLRNLLFIAKSAPEILSVLLNLAEP
jgi:hypothetical protein